MTSHTNMLYLNAEVYNMADKIDIKKIDEQLENKEVVDDSGRRGYAYRLFCICI